MKRYQNSQKNKSKTLEKLAMEAGRRAMERFRSETKQQEKAKKE